MATKYRVVSSHVGNPAALSLAALPSRSRRDVSIASSASALVSRLVSPNGTSRPSFSSVTRFGRFDVSQPTIGRPAAIASAHAMP